MRLFTFLAVLFFGFVATAQTADDFVFEVDLSSSGNSTYNFYITHVGNVSINWGDGQTSFFPNSQNRLVSHTYNINGNYTIYLNGQIDSFSFNRNEPLEVVQWGFSQFQTMEGAFEGCQNLVINSVDHPNLSQVTSMSNMFNGAKNFNSDISAWDVSNVTDMSGTFRLNWTFNINISNWDVSNVINMDEMFNSAILFNQPIGSWDVANVIDFTYMFLGAADFNQDLSSWDFQQTANLQDMLFSANLDTYNYDALIRNFLNLQLINKNLGISNFEYCDVFSRSQLTNRGWTITNDRQASNCSNQTLIGNILLDGDQNGCDFLDINVNTIAVNVNDGNYSFNYFTIDGAYSANLRPGNYTVVPIVDSQLFNITPDSIIITITPSGIVNQDFCVTATTPIDDLEITILPLEGARPGFDTNYKLIYKNKGNTRLSGSVDFTYEDDFMDFLNSNPATTSSSTGMLSWDFIDLDPFETREIEFTMNLNTPTDPNFPLNSNDVINFTAIINPALNDSTPLDNVFNIKQQVVNSYDPNDKNCLQGNRITPSMVGEYVHYRIRFENEGTASAVNVRIVDYIDTTKYDITTLTPLSASHDYTTTITEGNKVEFFFDNIMLPFTAPASQGYVLFKIKTVDTLVLGDDFSNQAEIYFDFNFPIITNLETTSVDMTASLNDNNLLEVSLYPNPAQNSISLTSNLAFKEYTIYDTLGAVVSQQKLEVATLNQEIQIDHLDSGLYFVEVKGNQSSSVLKLIKE